jgi:hypothetical protein
MSETLTEVQARAEADKRNRHKSKFMSDRLWRAEHDPVKGWHVRLGWVVETKWKLPA